MLVTREGDFKVMIRKKELTRQYLANFLDGFSAEYPYLYHNIIHLLGKCDAPQKKIEPGQLLPYYKDLLRNRDYSECGYSLYNIINVMKLSRNNAILNECFDNFDFGNIPLNGIEFNRNGEKASSFKRSVLNMANFVSGHTFYINCIAFSPCGNYIATGSSDNTAIIWDIYSGLVYATLIGHSSSIHALAYSPCGKYIATAGDNSVIIWNTKTGKVHKKLIGHTDTVWSVSFSPDGKNLITGASDKTALIWDVKTGKLLKKIVEHSGDSISHVMYSPCGKYFLTASLNGETILWETKNYKQHTKWQRHSGVNGGWSDAVFSPNGKYLAIYAWNEPITVWDVEEKRVHRKLDESVRSVGIAFSSDNKFLVGAIDNKVIVWNLETGIIHREISLGSYHVISAAFSPNRKYCLLGVLTGRSLIPYKDAMILNVETGTHKFLKECSNNCVDFSAFSPDGKYCIFGAKNNAPIIWNVNTGNIHKKLLSGYSSRISVDAISRDETYYFAGVNNAIVVWDMNTRKIHAILKRHTANITSIAFSHCEKYCISGSEDKSVRVWDLSKNIQSCEIICDNHVDSVAFLNDSERCIVKTRSYSSYSVEFRKIYIYNAVNGKLLKEIIRCTEYPNSHIYSSSKKYHAEYSIGNDVVIEDIVLDKEYQKLVGHSDAIKSVSFSSCEKYCITGSQDKTAIVWEIDTGKKIKVFECSESVCAVTFSSDGKYCATGLSEGNVIVWDCDKETENPINVFKCPGTILSVSFSSDSKYCAAGFFDGSIIIWDLKAGETPKKLLKNNCHADSLSFSKCNKYLISTNIGKTVIIWDIENGTIDKELTAPNYKNLISSAVLSECGEYCFAVEGSGHISRHEIIWEVKTGKIVLQDKDNYSNEITSSKYSIMRNKPENGSAFIQHRGSYEIIKILSKNNKEAISDGFSRLARKCERRMMQVRADKLYTRKIKKRKVVYSGIDSKDVFYNITNINVKNCDFSNISAPDKIKKILYQNNAIGVENPIIN